MRNPSDHTSRPPRLLVSVRDADEAVLACEAGADLVDAKDPERGALGALPAAQVRLMCERIGGRCATSAVAGEPEGDEALVAQVAAMAGTGVDWVKVALRRDHGALARAASAAPGRLIAVFFAEDGVRDDALPRLRAAGFIGAMIDTRGKDGRGLTDHLALPALSRFVAGCRRQGLLSGLAGSLRVGDIPALAALDPDYLGFRGGLCREGDRRQALDGQRVAEATRTLRGLGRRDAA